jgi:hypothetical protein
MLKFARTRVLIHEVDDPSLRKGFQSGVHIADKVTDKAEAYLEEIISSSRDCIEATESCAK